MEMFSSAGVDHMKTFNKLSSYDVDFLCEKIYVVMEQFVAEHKQSRSGKLRLSKPVPCCHEYYARNWYVDKQLKHKHLKAPDQILSVS